MEGSRSLSLLLSLQGLSVATASLADEAEQHILYGRALEERQLGRACYSGHYDAGHLRTHPKQKVEHMAMLAYRLEWQGAEASILDFEARFRDAGTSVEFSGECRVAAGGVLACGIECDGGEFSRRGASGSILVDIPSQPGLCDGADGTSGAGFGADDKRFRPDRADMSDCRGLIWDDEIRPRLLKAAGQQSRNTLTWFPKF